MIDNTQDVIDSREVIERMGELDGMYSTRDGMTDDEIGERKALRALHSQGADYAEDWQYGATLVRDSYFVEYAQELADDVQPFSDNSPEGQALASWPYRCIDWDQAARELQMDYTSIDFDGVTYWVR